MGRVMSALVDEREGIDIVARVDKVYDNYGTSCNFKDIKDVNVKADAIVDFSHQSATRDVLLFALEHNTPLVLATTGQTAEDEALIEQVSNTIPIFYAHNMSKGIALINRIIESVAKEYYYADIEIIETHHNEKRDAPSGSALMLADTIQSTIKQCPIGTLYAQKNTLNIDCDINCYKSQCKNIPIHSLRLGIDVGKHEVVFDSGCERIMISHQAFSRNIYAEGAIDAIHYIVNKERGIYTMHDIITRY